MTKEELLEKANSLPLAPGVYLMHDKEGTVIYVGKAKRLKNRVSQYFQAGRGHNLKTQTMVKLVDTFDTIVVGSEFEALVLENALIKQYMPRYNILLKDDKGYPFVRLSREQYRGFPRDIGKERPCLNHHMGRCDGFCRPEMSREEYERRVDIAVQLLEGKIRLVTAQLEREMEAAAEELRFEEAAALRDRIAAIKVLGKRQKVIAGVCADTDVWGLYLEAKCCFAVLHYEEGQLTGKEAELFAASALEEEGEILSALLLQYYGSRSALPREIFIPAAIEDQEVLEQLLGEKAGHRVTVRTPQRGDRAQVLALAAANAREEAERQTTSQERSDRTLELLGKLMGLEEPPEWMESYDISNTGGEDVVASMVVFRGSRPAKDRYRRFRIKELDGHPDDYKSMEEVLTRRLTHYMEQDKKFMPLPPEPRQERAGLRPGRDPRRGGGPAHGPAAAVQEREGGAGGQPGGAGGGGAPKRGRGGVPVGPPAGGGKPPAPRIGQRPLRYTNTDPAGAAGSSGCSSLTLFYRHLTSPLFSILHFRPIMAVPPPIQERSTRL